MGCGASLPMDSTEYPKPSYRRPSRLPSKRIDLEHCSTGRFGEKYLLLNTVLGQGSFAVVKHCKEKRSGELRACKILNKNGSGDRQVQSTQSLNDEIAIFRQAGSHPNILQIYDVYETATLVYMVLELAKGGTLTERIQQQGISEADASSALRQATEAVKHLHANSIVHRDIKLDNILLEAPNTFVVKLADFGLSKLVKHAHERTISEGDGRMMMASAQGSPAFMPPELFELCMVYDGANPSGKLIYDQTVDIWGLGIVCCMLVTGVHPLQGLRTWQEFLLAMNTGKLTRFDEPHWEPISAACKDLLRAILQQEPTERATPQQILAHEWICKTGVAPTSKLPHVLDGLKRLRLHSLQKIVLQVMEKRLQKDELEDMNRLFDELDLDKTGKIRRPELATVIKKQGKDAHSEYAAALDVCFDALDLKGDGVISLSEFRAAVLAQHGQLMNQLLRPVFDQIDSHGTGDISADELVAALRQLGGSDATLTEIEAQALLKDFDENGSSTLTFEEFRKMMSRESMSSMDIPRAPADKGAPSQ